MERASLQAWITRYLDWFREIAPHPASPVSEIYSRQQIRMLSAIILPYHVVSTVFIVWLITSGTVGVVKVGVLLVSFVMLSMSLYLSRTRYYWMGLGIFLAALVVHYISFALVAQDRATLYSLTMMVLLSVFISSLFFPPRIIAYSAAGGLLVIGCGLLLTVVAPTLRDLTLTVGMALFFFEIILFSSYIQQETNHLIEQQTEALVESESRFRSIFDQSFHLAVFMHPDGTIIDANEKTMRLFGAFDERILGRRLWELPLWQYASRPIERVQADVKQVAAGRTLHYESNFGTAANKQHTFDIWLRPVFSERESVYLIVLMGRDITAYKRHEQRRQLEAMRYKALFEAMGDGIFIFDTDECITTVNPNGAAMLGYTVEEMQGMPLQKVILGAGELNDMRRNMQHLLDGETLTPYERALKRKDGTPLPVEINPTVMWGSDGKPLYIQATFRDLTNRKRAERHEAELRLERERTGLLRSFVTNVSHDFRTPLSNIKTSAYLLGRLKGEKFEHHRDVIDTSVNQLTQMIDDQLNAIREEMPIEDEMVSRFPVDVNQLVRDVVIGAQNTITEGNVSVNVALDTDVPMVLGNGDRLKIALRHLVANAVKFTPPGAQVKLCTTTSPRHVHIHIIDQGKGIPEDELPHIFNSLYRGDDARQGGGAGLGLTIAHKIVTAHQGDIEVKSEVGSGSEFIVSLPKIPARENADSTTHAPEPPG